MTIFKVISNIKHNGTDFTKGSFIADEFVGSEILVNDGVLKVIEGAETIEEAKAIDAETQAIEESAEEVVEPKDTWAPEPDEPIVATGTIVNEDDPDFVYTGPMGKYKIVGEIFPLNEDGSQKDTPIEIGSIHEVPESVGEEWVLNALAEKVDESTGPVEPSIDTDNL